MNNYFIQIIILTFGIGRGYYDLFNMFTRYEYIKIDHFQRHFIIESLYSFIVGVVLLIMGIHVLNNVSLEEKDNILFEIFIFAIFNFIIFCYGIYDRENYFEHIISWKKMKNYLNSKWKYLISDQSVIEFNHLLSLLEEGKISINNEELLPFIVSQIYFIPTLQPGIKYNLNFMKSQQNYYKEFVKIVNRLTVDEIVDLIEKSELPPPEGGGVT